MRRLHVDQSRNVLVDVGFPRPLGSTATGPRSKLQRATSMSTVSHLGLRFQRGGGGALPTCFLKGEKEA